MQKLQKPEQPADRDDVERSDVDAQSGKEKSTDRRRTRSAGGRPAAAVRIGARFPWRPLLCAAVSAQLLACAAAAGAAQQEEEALRCMALNLYHETRSQPRHSKVAVAWVVLNRVSHEDFPETVCAVVHEGGESPPCEWSWWCDGEPDEPQNPEAWAETERLARKFLSDPPPDPTEGALWFHHVAIEPPPWTRDLERTVRIGEHVFYRKRD